MARLLATEARLEQELRQARDEAAALITSAREAAAAREAALEEALDGEGGRLEERILDEQRRLEAGIVEQAARAAREFDAVGDERIAALARYVVERVIGGEP